MTFTGQHDATLTQMLPTHYTFVCCDEPKPAFMEMWNASGKQASTWVFGAPSEVFDRILQHVTKGHDDEDTHTVRAAASTLTGLGGKVEDAILFLHEQLPYLHVEFAML